LFANLPCGAQRTQFLAAVGTQDRVTHVTRWTLRAGRGALIAACLCGIAFARARTKRTED
jgi:ABC-type Fe3+ transport system permease subunit